MYRAAYRSTLQYLGYARMINGTCDSRAIPFHTRKYVSHCKRFNTAGCVIRQDARAKDGSLGVEVIRSCPTPSPHHGSLVPARPVQRPHIRSQSLGFASDDPLRCKYNKIKLYVLQKQFVG